MGNRSTLEKFGVALSILKNPWMLLLDKLGLVKDPIYKSKTGMSFQTRGKTTDINDAVVVLSGKEYPEELVGLSTVDSEGVNTHAVVLDCGGHIGSFTMYVKSQWPNARIWTMEPVPDNISLFKSNIARNNLSNVTLIPYALYGQSGTFYIDLAGKQYDAVNVTTQKPSHDQFVIIEAKTLAEVVAENNLEKIDLLKMDIEGAEYHIFQHSLADLAKYVRRIIMEFHPAGNVAKRNEIVNRLCGGNASSEEGATGPFELIFESKNILGFQNKQL